MHTGAPHGHGTQGDFSVGSIRSLLFRQALPLTIGLVVNALYNVVDRIYIGHIPGVGTDALTGVGLAFPIISIIAAFYNLCVTGSADFAISRGAGDDARAAKVQDNIFLLLLLFSIALTAAGYAFKESVLRRVGAEGALFTYANEYLDIYLIGTPLVLFSLGLNPQINAQGAPRIAMASIIIGAVANTALDPVFIYLFDMGVRGAAIATVLSQLLSAVWVLGYLTRRAEIRLDVRRLKPDVRVMRRILSLGLSGFTMQATNSIISLVFNSQLLLFGGSVFVSAMTIVNTLREMTYLPASGITHAMRPILGYNYGAKKYARVRGTVLLVLRICIVYNIVLWAVFMAVPGVFVRMFLNDAAVYPIAVKSVRIFFSAFFIMSLMMVAQSTFVGLGFGKRATFFSFFRKVLINVPFALLLPRLTALGAYGVFWAEPISECVGGTAAFTCMMLTVWPLLKRGDDGAPEAEKAERAPDDRAENG